MGRILKKDVSNILKKMKESRFWNYIGVDIILDLFISVIYFFILFRSGAVTLIYDTAVQRSIANGDMIGYPNPHLIISNYLLGLILAFLYKILPMWEWYTLMLLFSMYFSLWAVIYRMMSLVKDGAWFSAWKILIGLATLFLFDLLFFSNLVSIYFFNCALIAGVSAFVYIIFTKELKIKDVIIVLVLIVLCAGIRFSVFKEILPFFFIAFIIRFFVFKKRKYLLQLMASMVLIIGIMYIVNEQSYTGIYANEKEVNHYRAAIQDYGKWVEYEGNEEFFESLGMDELEYSVMKSCWGLSDHLNKETLIAICELFEEVNLNKEVLNEQKNKLIENLFKNDYKMDFWLMECISIIFTLFVILKKKDWRMLSCYMGVIAIVAGEILYLAYRGRMPIRVTMGPLLILMFTGVGYILQYFADFRQLMNTSKLLRFGGILLLSVFVLKGYQYSESAHKYLQYNYANTTDGMVINYFLNDQENIYFCYGRNDYLDLHNPIKRNYTGWGGWISETIDWKTMLQGEYDNVWDALAYRDDIRLVISSDAMELMQRYLDERGYKCHSECEQVVLDENNVMDVWRFVSDN